MDDWTRRFIDLAREAGALKFGRFELKSGRISPYFFNAGAFDRGRLISGIADCYADAIVDSGIAFESLFGPAYKGIPLAASVSMSLYTRHGLDVPVAYNRKEAKMHGEGGALVGTAPAGRVMVIDDVISAGTAFSQAASTVAEAGGQVRALTVGLDRQERGATGASARSQIERGGVSVIAVATLDDLIASIEAGDQGPEIRSAMLEYRDEYGA